MPPADAGTETGTDPRPVQTRQRFLCPVPVKFLIYHQPLSPVEKTSDFCFETIQTFDNHFPCMEDMGF